MTDPNLPPPFDSVHDTEIPQASNAPLFTLDKLAEMHNQLAPVAVDGGRFFAKHRVADTLHGWSHYEYHQGCPVLLTVEDYRKALEDHTAEDGSYKVHEPAVRKISEKHSTNGVSK